MIKKSARGSRKSKAKPKSLKVAGKKTAGSKQSPKQSPKRSPKRSMSQGKKSRSRKKSASRKKSSSGLRAKSSLVLQKIGKETRKLKRSVERGAGKLKTGFKENAKVLTGDSKTIREKVRSSPEKTDSTNDFIRPASNRDPLTGETGSHPLGTGLGAAGGASTGAVIGSIGGPIGAAIGAVVGGVAGAVVGKGAAEVVDPTDPNAPKVSQGGNVEPENKK